VLSRVTFKDDWPTERTRARYERAAREGNFEANMKLGVACLYGEGCAAAPALASEMLMRAEQLAGPNDPFSWLLYRPPWSSDTCSKALIFKDMLALAEENKDVISKRYSGIMYCAAKTLWCVALSRFSHAFLLAHHARPQSARHFLMCLLSLRNEFCFAAPSCCNGSIDRIVSARMHATKRACVHKMRLVRPSRVRSCASPSLELTALATHSLIGFEFLCLCVCRSLQAATR
jgi:hypothetical protein